MTALEQWARPEEVSRPGDRDRTVEYLELVSCYQTGIEG